MEKIIKLRKLLNFHNLDGYIIPKNDEFFSEYIKEDKDRLKFISNFSGSNGIAIILKKKNYLFTDGRYTIQANKQCGKNFIIVTMPKKLPLNIFKNVRIKIGYDPKLHTRDFLNKFFFKTNCDLVCLEKNLVDELRLDKKKAIIKKFYSLPKKAIGLSYKFKLDKLIEKLLKKKIDFQFVSSSENIAWLLNIRGFDSEFSPLPNAYLIIDTNKKLTLFCNLKKIGKSFKDKFNNIKFENIKNVELILSSIKEKKVLIDTMTCSVFFEKILEKRNSILKHLDPIYNLKSIKSNIEIKNTKKTHIYDGAAVTKFLFWVKNNYNKRIISEISAEKKLLQFRRENKNFKFSSFPTISGSGPNGAIIHYRADKQSNRILRKGDIYLVDSGGQYNFGTTDITRTISLDNKSKLVKNIFTRVLKGHIAVASYKIKKNTNGAQIDAAARKFLKKKNLDYAHGTGHGVGYFLNVHEGPQSISKNNKTNFKEGMILSNEPGYYKKGKFGIRIENLVSVKKNKKNYFFENLTMSPIDKSLISKDILEKHELNWINEYHKSVYKKLKHLMNKKDLNSLKSACSAI